MYSNCCGWIILVLSASGVLSPTVQAAEYHAVPGGDFVSVLPPDGKAALAQVSAFSMRTEPVTNAEFLQFVRNHVRWRRDRVQPLFADSQYLAHWMQPDLLGDSVLPDQPVIQVSWYAARAYCDSEQARLPTWYEWEYVAAADATRVDARSDPAWRAAILNWYAEPSSGALARIGQTTTNIYGIKDMHGLVWEWVEDFASLMVSADNREQGDPDLKKFCGAGALSMQQRENYAILMRIAMLSALQAAHTTRNLGFRCVRQQATTHE